MYNAKKITSYFFVATISISLLAGYFCFAPNMAQAISNMSYSSHQSNSSYSSGCQDTIIPDHYMLSSAAPSSVVPPCCLEKNDSNSQLGAINLNNFLPDNVSPQSASVTELNSNDSANYAVSLDYPISPTQTGISSSINLIE